MDRICPPSLKVSLDSTALENPREDVLYKYFLRLRHGIYKVKGRTELVSLNKEHSQ